jgi:hypothetical protein
MSDTVIIPTADAVITPVLEKLYELRPSSFRHLNLRSGVYWHPVLGYRAQAARMLQRLTQLAGERRLKTAEGTALLDYVASEFGPLPETDKTFAYGAVTLARTDPAQRAVVNIPKGTKILRTAFTSLGVKFAAAEYETLADAMVPYASTATITIPVKATSAGADANAPILYGNTTTGITAPSLGAPLSVLGFEAAGGSDGPKDDFVRLYAKTYALGQYGPTLAASRLGALSATGVRHLVTYDAPSSGTQTILVADESWASSQRWADRVLQNMYDSDVVGFGCKIAVYELRNKVVTATATVSLRDPQYLTDTSEIDVAIGKALRSFLDDRPDFTSWTYAAMKSAISRAHPKIFSCTAVLLKDAFDGSSISEPTGSTYFHFLLASNSVATTYTGPA